VLSDMVFISGSMLPSGVARPLPLGKEVQSA